MVGVNNWLVYWAFVVRVVKIVLLIPIPTLWVWIYHPPTWFGWPEIVYVFVSNLIGLSAVFTAAEFTLGP